MENTYSNITSTIKKDLKTIEHLLTDKTSFECSIKNWRSFQQIQKNIHEGKFYDFDAIEEALKSKLEPVNQKLDEICKKGYTIGEPELYEQRGMFPTEEYAVKAPDGGSYKVSVKLKDVKSFINPLKTTRQKVLDKACYTGFVTADIAAHIAAEAIGRLRYIFKTRKEGKKWT